MSALDIIQNQIEEAKENREKYSETTFYDGVVFGLKLALSAINKETEDS